MDNIWNRKSGPGAPNKKVLKLIASDDPGCGRKFEPKLCLLRRRANLLKEERGIRPDGDLCAYCPVAIEYEKSMEERKTMNEAGCKITQETAKIDKENQLPKKSCKKCQAPTTGKGKTGLCRSCSTKLNRLAAKKQQKTIDLPGVGHYPAPVSRMPSIEKTATTENSEDMRVIDRVRKATAYTLAKHGHRRQLLKTAEECAELAAAINRYLADFDGNTATEVVEEAADVSLCIEYVRLIFGDKAFVNSVDNKAGSLLARFSGGNKS